MTNEEVFVKIGKDKRFVQANDSAWKQKGANNKNCS
jgi:hypothetical protein